MKVLASLGLVAACLIATPAIAGPAGTGLTFTEEVAKKNLQKRAAAKIQATTPTAPRNNPPTRPAPSPRKRPRHLPRQLARRPETVAEASSSPAARPRVLPYLQNAREGPVSRDTRVPPLSGWSRREIVGSGLVPAPPRLSSLGIWILLATE
jgi:hypothetical protein